MRAQLLLIAIAISSGCTADSPDQSAVKAKVGSALLTSACPLSIRMQTADGSVDPYPIVRPDDVQSILAAPPMYEGEVAMLVTLKPEAAARLHRSTKEYVRGRAIVFCGKEELNRFAYLEPVGAPLRLAIPE